MCSPRRAASLFYLTKATCVQCAVPSQSAITRGWLGEYELNAHYYPQGEPVVLHPFHLLKTCEAGNLNNLARGCGYGLSRKVGLRSNVSQPYKHDYTITDYTIKFKFYKINNHLYCLHKFKKVQYNS